MPRRSESGTSGPTPAPRGRAALFLDRDGTIIEDAHYLGEPERVRLLPGAADAIARVNRAGIPVVVVTNQSGIGRGFYDMAAYREVAARLDALLADHGAHLDATYLCPHTPDARPPCDCRKPAPGLFLRAAREHNLDLSASTFVGDRLRDLLPGIDAGGQAYLVGKHRDEAGTQIPPGVTRVTTLEEAVADLLERN